MISLTSNFRSKHKYTTWKKKLDDCNLGQKLSENITVRNF